MIQQIFSFGENDLSPLLFVTNVSRAVHPSRSLTETAVPGMDGALLSSVKLDPTDVTVACAVRAKTVEEVAEMRRRLGWMLSGSRPARLVLPDEPSTYLMAVYAGSDELSRLANTPTVALKFHCLDPVAYGEHRTEMVEGTKLVRVGGTYASLPTVTVKPPSGSYWKITNVTTGEFVRVAAAFTGAQTLVLDFAKQRCTINGADSRVDVSSDYFSISDDVRLSVSGGQAKVEWDERWL